MKKEIIVIGFLLVALISWPAELLAQSSFIQLTDTTGVYFKDLSISGDGNRVVFLCDANLTGENSDGSDEIFLWDENTGIRQITNSPPGTWFCTSVGDNFCPSISSNGRRITFSSSGDFNPGAPGNADGNEEIFLWSEGTGFTQITNTLGLYSNGEPSISGDGGRIAFLSYYDLTSGDPTRLGGSHIYLWTEGTGFTRITNTSSTHRRPSINFDGTRLVFESFGDLTPGMPGNSDMNREIFLWTEGSSLIQITNTIGGASGFGGNLLPVINSDGNRIAFMSDRDLTPLAPGNAGGNIQIFLWTEGAGFTQVTNVLSSSFADEGISISGDGSSIAFSSIADLVSGSNMDGSWEIFLWTEGEGFIQVTNTASRYNQKSSINSDGSRIAFISDADLTLENPGNADGSGEIFLVTFTPASGWLFKPPFALRHTWSSSTSLASGPKAAAATGISGVVRNETEITTGELGYTAFTWGGFKGFFNSFKKAEDKPDQMCTVEAALGVEFVPSFTGNAKIVASISLDGKGVGQSGPGAVDYVAKFLPYQIPFLGPSKSLFPTVATAKNQAFMEINGSRNYSSLQGIAVTSEIFFPHHMEVDYGGKNVIITSTFAAREGEPITILVGLNSELKSWGNASMVMNLENSQLDYILLTIE